MFRLQTLVPLFVFFMLPACVSAQVTDATICDIIANPVSFDGKIVRIKATAVAGFKEFVVRDESCPQPSGAVWLAYPAGTDGKAGPAVNIALLLAKNHPITPKVRDAIPVALDKNKDFKEFDNLLATPAKASALCLACPKFLVHATLIGRVDGSEDSGFQRNSDGKVVGVSGYGDLNSYKARLVLQSVSEVVAKEIDYSKNSAHSPVPVTTGAYLPSSPKAEDTKRAAEAFGRPGDDNGVNVGFGRANETSKNDILKASSNSPDGLIFDVTFDGDRLKGSAMQMALSHLGTHIADVRSTDLSINGLSPYGSEFRAWQTCVIGAIVNKAKVLTLPGSYIIYDAAWPQASLGQNANAGITSFLSSWLMLENQPRP